ncbi:uncharacterized protein MJAP1_002882 [Malassezia japonica]|uniref:RRM domain-containing protein n=1 Tax=Malassezia japonica TaxID=223818 RepID=A0AAF0JB57_9BASI|nr:uncharacterized protein MJAP1_002882 [Malassezia japonica]WFD39900.1 hypothetical protein MJAP1_002882 [Malassezia japonica]
MSEPSARLYIGRLPQGCLREDISDLFRGLGRIVDVRVLNGFGFVEFDDPRDAELAVRDFDGTMFMGDRIIVQFAKQPQRRGDEFGRGGRERERDPYGAPRGYDRYESRPPRRGPRRGDFRIVVFNLPPGTSWQDLKDIGREHGHVVYSDINPSRPDEGALEFEHRDDYERALAKIEGTELRVALARRRASPRDGDRWGRDARPPPPMRDDRDYRDDRAPRDYRDERAPPRDDYRDDRAPLPPRDDYREERAPLPPRDDYREERAPLPPRDDYREERAPLPPRDDDERAPLPPRDDEREPLPPRDESAAPVEEHAPAPPSEDTPAPSEEHAPPPPPDSEPAAPTEAPPS